LLENTLTSDEKASTKSQSDTKCWFNLAKKGAQFLERASQRTNTSIRFDLKKTRKNTFI
jgi:hypothetical protein